MKPISASSLKDDSKPVSKGAERFPILVVAGGESLGGAEVNLVAILCCLPAERYEPIVICKRSSYLSRFLPKVGVEVWEERIPAWRKSVSRLMMPLFLLRSSRRAKQRNVALVVANDVWTAPQAHALGQWLKCPALAFAQDSIITADKAKQYRLDRFKRIVTVSESMHASLSEFLPCKHIETVHCIVDAARFASENQSPVLRKEFGVGDGEILIVMVGAVSAMKGQELLYDALLEDIRNGAPYRMLFVGRNDSEFASKFQRRVQEEGFEKFFAFVGFREDVSNCLASADIFVHLSERESFGLAMAEAMASGKPCIYASCPALRELAGDRGGIPVRRDDPVEIRNAVNTLANGPEIRARIGREARTRIQQKYSPGDQMRGLVKIIEDMIARTESKRSQTG